MCKTTLGSDTLHEKTLMIAKKERIRDKNHKRKLEVMDIL